jgi:hypothetical protein
MGILFNPSRYLTAKGKIAIKKVGHAQLRWSPPTDEVEANHTDQQMKKCYAIETQTSG